jgi:phosphoribosylformylglycinamidine synthase subunit PurL
LHQNLTMAYPQPPVSLKIAQSLGLLPEEFDKIINILGREPNFTELSIFSVMWSEHCSYKNSIKYLKTLPRDGGKLLVGAGEENAGLVDIGNGLACAFKIESHNHPSAIEPYQGAATGVGGIHRDIFTMGARPIAALNSLRFGDLSLPHTRHLVRGVVKGIGDYGNCFGVPTVGGEVFFNPCFNQNILVNAMSAGIVKVGETISASADGPGNPVFIVGSATGKDGIHGATFASADLTEDSAKDLPAVQVGDPFQEKLLLEASLEVIKSGVVVGMQDMGAAGITCSTSEMSAKSGTGMIIHLDKVPTRQANMQPFEILLSESQERMLVICEKGKEAELMAIFDKWDLACAQIGEVTNTQRLHFYMHGELVADVPAHDLVLGGGAPVYDRPYSEPQYFRDLAGFDIDSIPLPSDWVHTAEKLWHSPNLASKRWIFEQYDNTVRTNSRTNSIACDAAVVRVKTTDQALVLTTDCNPAYVHADPYKGTMIAVCEAARNIICSGGEPLAITNCLNFGNPYNPEVYWQFVHAIKGMGEACRKLDTPVTGGNVSFYNQTVYEKSTEPVFPTPTIGMLGLMEDSKHLTTLSFQNEGDLIYLIGQSRNDLGSSEYLRTVHQIPVSPCPYFDLEEEFHHQQILISLIRDQILLSAHDISDGGLFAALIEGGMANGKGFKIETDAAVRKDAFLFGESQSRYIVTITAESQAAFESKLKSSLVPFRHLGQVTNGGIKIDHDSLGEIGAWKKTFEKVIPAMMDRVEVPDFA